MQARAYDFSTCMKNHPTGREREKQSDSELKRRDSFCVGCKRCRTACFLSFSLMRMSLDIEPPFGVWRFTVSHVTYVETCAAGAGCGTELSGATGRGGHYTARCILTTRRYPHWLCIQNVLGPHVPFKFLRLKMQLSE